MSGQEMTGLRKTAILLVQMGREASTKILAQMHETEIEELTTEIARLGSVETGDAEGVLTEFHELATANQYSGQGGLDYARELLEGSLGEERASEIVGRLSKSISDVPFNFLQRADSRQLLSFLQDEHPQTIALVLAHMNPDAAAMVMGSLPEEQQRDVAIRIATMDRTSPEVIEQVEAILERKLSTVIQQSDFAQAGGLQTLVDILNSSDRATERLILEGLEHQDAELADEVRNRMFVFEDITNLDDRAVQMVLRSVDTKELAVALKGVDPKVRGKVTGNMSERAAANLTEEIQLLGPMKLKTVEEAQAAIVRVIRTLEESGQIDMSRGGDELVV
jgi:flagellar motor switch protein FliG